MSNDKSDYGQNFNAEMKNKEGKFKSKISGKKAAGQQVEEEHDKVTAGGKEGKQEQTGSEEETRNARDT